jgi:hypothetical protein
LKNISYVLEDFKESISAHANILSCVRADFITMDGRKVLRRINSERMTPIPAKITFVGENTCKRSMRMQILDRSPITDKERSQLNRTISSTCFETD